MPDLQQAITAIKSGDKATGKQLLIEIIKADPGNETAWLWMTQVVSMDQERLRCLQNVLKINPNNEMAKKGLAKLNSPQSLKSVGVKNTVLQQPVEQSSPQPIDEPVPILSESSTSVNQPIKSKLVKPIQPISESKNDSASPKPAKIIPKADTKNHTLIYISAIAFIGIVISCLGCFTFSLVVMSSPSYKATQTAPSLAEATRPEPTPTFTPLMQATPIPTVPSTPAPTNTSLPTNTPMPTSTLIPSDDTSVERWIPIGGRIWTGLKVYYGTGSEKAYGFEVLGGSEDCYSMPSGRGVKVRFPSGSEEWKDRDYLISSGLFFAVDSDPALSAMQWYVYDDC